MMDTTKAGNSMNKYSKLIERILGGHSDADIGFDDLRQLLVRLGFEQRIRGSHHIFRKSGVEERINLQRDGKNSKPYQVQQVRDVILKYRLEEQE
jgi:predicted RNA binding protein YcfA (HicA-like mRNA interferase family)